jgi:hypothetical protein
MLPHSTYYWQIISTDNHGVSTTGPIWNFTTLNNPPNTPNTPSPVHQATDIGVTPVLSWVGGDPDGDSVTYDVYFGTSSSPPLVSSNQSGTTYIPGTLQFNTLYYWQIVAWDTYGGTTTGPLWEFTTETNYPPNDPRNPYPENESTNVDIDQNLAWLGGDPNGHAVTYDLYFGTSVPPPKIADDLALNNYDPGTMAYSTTYYWKIVAEDEYGLITEGPLWHFTTMRVPTSDLKCTGSLSWTQVPAGSTQEGTFTLRNQGDPESLLDWEVSEWPDWGTWTFTPSSGDDLTPEAGTITIQVEVVAPDQQEESFSGEIKVSNLENASDFELIPVSLTTPMPYTHPIINLLQQFLERFPLLSKILQLLQHIIT